MTTNGSRTVKVYCLASFNDEEADEILSQLDDDSHCSYSSANVQIELIPWTENREGGKDDIFRLFFENQDDEEDFMFFLDRRSLQIQDFLVADVRSAKRALSKDRSSPANWSVIGTNDYDEHTVPLPESGHVQIVYGRCGRDHGWYGSPYSGIRKTYTSLIGDQSTLDRIVYKNKTERAQPNETDWMSSVLDICDQAYHAQVCLTRNKTGILRCEAQVRPSDGDGGASRSTAIPIDRNPFYLLSPQWALQA